MNRYQRLRLVAAVILLVELTLGLLGTLTPQREIFPFASWFLFSLVPDRVVSYDLLLHGPSDQPLDPPRPYNLAGGLVKSPHSVTAYQLIQQLGRAQQTGDRARIRRLRRQIEAGFAAAPPMRYDLVRMSYTPAERWKNPQDSPPRVPVTTFVSGEESDAAPDNAPDNANTDTPPNGGNIDGAPVGNIQSASDNASADTPPDGGSQDHAGPTPTATPQETL